MKVEWRADWRRRRYNLALKCPNCDEPFPKRAYLMLSFGARSFRCPNCGAISTMNPTAAFKWTFAPMAAILGMVLLAIWIGSYWIAVVGFILVRAVWVFISPRLIPMDLFLPRR